MQMTNLGKRYASALLSIAVQEEKNEEYREYVKMIISILDEDDSLIRLLDSANLTKKYNDNLKVDTIKIDCSNKEESCVRTINISDIRFIDSYSTSGFQELERDIKTFK